MNWFTQARDQNIPISGSILKAKAEYFGGKLKDTTFKDSDGWLEKFQSRNNIKWKKICGESTSVKIDDADQWKIVTLLDHIKNYEHFECR